MQYQQVYQFLMPKLENELPEYLSYHNAEHTKSVIAAAPTYQLRPVPDKTNLISDASFSAVMRAPSRFAQANRARRSGR